MDVIEGWRALAEEVGPKLALPVASAVVITLLWALTGWGAFDVTVWPWALGAVPVALLAGLRLSAASARHERASEALRGWTNALRAAGRELDGADRDIVRAVIRVGQSRLGGRGALELSELLDADTHAKVRESGDPLSALLDEAADRGVSAATIAAARDAMGSCDGLSMSDAPFARSGDLTVLFLTTLPVGLVTTTGWWTFAAIAGVSVAYLAIDVMAAKLEQPFGLGSSLPVEATHADAERALGPRAAT